MTETLMLVKPSEEYVEEIRAFRQEIIEDGGRLAGVSGLLDYENTIEWVEHCRLMERKETLPNLKWVEADQFMLVVEGSKRALGLINFRHYLNEYLAESGGHIGYMVRPSERRKGYAKAMLALCLDKCWERDLDRVLVTCATENEASRRTIMSCGGMFDRLTVGGEETMERYWIDNEVCRSV
ncbi:acetyltransferase [Clostridia bacterium]|nr:acetyltransferase [Clostridia bacterium]